MYPMAFMCFWISHFYQPSIRSFVSTSVRVIKIFPSAKPDSRVTFYSIPLIASSDADSCFAITSVFAHRVKPLLVTLIELQGGLRTNLQLSRIKLAANKIVQTANEWPRFKTWIGGMKQKKIEYIQRKYLPEKILPVIWPRWWRGREGSIQGNH